MTSRIRIYDVFFALIVGGTITAGLYAIVSVIPRPARPIEYVPSDELLLLEETAQVTERYGYEVSELYVVFADDNAEVSGVAKHRTGRYRFLLLFRNVDGDWTPTKLTLGGRL